MKPDHYRIEEHTFLRHFRQHSPQLMWLLGAGSSRSSGLPTALDLIWDLKRLHYCAKENQDLQAHKVSNPAIREKIQGYFDAMHCPPQWSPEEYSYYFELVFRTDHRAQQSYIQEQMSPDKVTLTIGPRVLAALLALSHTRVVFTTNFDDVLESAYSVVSGQSLSPFHLEGSYAALDALNAERFPLYAKIHGDFRYKSMKNMSTALRSNDAEIQKCFISAAGRHGLIVAGYSGRDANVMSMLQDSLQQPNPFPLGIWWAVPNARSLAPPVIDFLQAAKDKALKAHVLETGTFDAMMYKIWRQTPDRPQELDLKVRSAPALSVSIPRPEPGTRFPVLRTNALEVIDAPSCCGYLVSKASSSADVLDAVKRNRPGAVISYHDGVVFWGNAAEVLATVESLVEDEVTVCDLGDPVLAITESTHLKSFFEHGLAEALCREKPVLLRKMRGTYYAVADFRVPNHPAFDPLRKALGIPDGAPLGGVVPQLPDTFWSEAVRLKLEERAGVLWLLLEPDIWIRPLVNRRFAADFLRTRKLKRYNIQSFNILSAWIKTMLGPVGQGPPVTVQFAPGSSYPATFTVSTRTAYSRRGTM